MNNTRINTGMKDTKREYKECIELLYSAQNDKPAPDGWEKLNFDGKDKIDKLDAAVYKKGNRIVIAYKGTDWPEDVMDDLKIILTSRYIPRQYYQAEALYNAVKKRYPYEDIESIGYSFGGSLSNLLSRRTGIRSIAIAPVGGNYIAEANKAYFKYDGSNAFSFAHANDVFSKVKENNQIGTFNVLPGRETTGQAHLLGDYYKFASSDVDFFLAQKKEDSFQNIIRRINETTKAPASVWYNQSELKKYLNNLYEQNWQNAQQTLRGGVAKTGSNIGRYVKNSLQGVLGGNPTGYAAPVNDGRTFFTNEDIKKMSTDEFLQSEDIIDNQILNKFAITRQEALDGVNNGMYIHVQGYVRKDGTKVSDYYRLR